MNRITMDEPEKVRGRVRWYDADKGYGFIITPVGKDIFVHFQQIIVRCPTCGGEERKGAGSLKTGQVVEFELHEMDRGPAAKNVRVVCL